MIKKKIVHEIASHDKDADFSISRAIEIYKHLNKLKSIKNKDRKAVEFMRKDVKAMREELKYILTSAYLMVFKRKNSYFEFLLDGYKLGEFTPRTKDQKVNEYLKSRYAEWIEADKTQLKELKEYRSKLLQPKMSRKENLGFVYNMEGNVFNKPGQVVALQTIENQLNRISRAKKPSEKDTSNFIGIELELVAKVDRKTLNDLLCKAYLAGYVYVKDDSSIQRENTGDFSHEVTVLCREHQVTNVVTKLCEVLNSKQVGSYVNNSCGLHVHIDSRNRKPEHVYTNIASCLPMLKGLVPKNRVESEHANRYCKINTSADWSKADHHDRYMAVNSEAYKKYKTIEIRMHSGTTNAAKIINWVTILNLAAKHPTILTKEITTPYEYQAIIGCDSKLVSYMIKRTDLFTGALSSAVDTRADHFFYDEVVAI